MSSNIISTEVFDEKQNVKWDTLDGNTAASHVAYALIETSFIFPITPSSSMAENVDEWAAKGIKNIWNRPVEVTEMQSEGGAAGSIHGALSAGSLAATFTASQGLLLMVPNMFKIAGELLPAVFHVSARSISTQALCIFGDHSDVMAARGTGFCMLSSHSVGECMDMALVAHIAAVKCSLPFLHFFDGFRTSHEVSKVPVLNYDDIRNLVLNDKEYYNKYIEFKKRSMSPNHPNLRGTAQGPDVFFQYCESNSIYYEKVGDIVQKTFDQVATISGRHYHLFDYIGAKDATDVIIIMGSAAQTVEEAVVNLVEKKNKKVGMLKVRLYRPFLQNKFLESLPKTVKRIAVLDRTREPGATGEPLFQDVVMSFYGHNLQPIIIGGRYGLGSKDFGPNSVVAVFDNLAQNQPKNHFTVGIIDDVCYTSIPMGPSIDTTPLGTKQSLFYGLGSDGTVSANKEAIKIIGNHTPLYAQAYFQYDAHKSGGVTISHLRFGPKPITSTYLVTTADYVGVHFQNYCYRYNMAKSAKPGAFFVLNSSWSPVEIEKNLPNSLKIEIAKRRLKFYNIDAIKVATKAGLGKRINMVMQSVFFKLSEIIPYDKAVDYLKQGVKKAFSKKGDAVVQANYRALDAGIESLFEVNYPATWADLPLEEEKKLEAHDAYVNDVMMPMLALKGDDLPVSACKPGGVFPAGTTKYEKRCISLAIPEWDKTKCTQCNYCSVICPHACIRPFVEEDKGDSKAPPSWETLKALGGPEYEGLRYRIQVSPSDCTGCQLCTSACPDNALKMVPINTLFDDYTANWEYAMTLPNLSTRFSKNTVKGSQFIPPLMEFSGACDGCGETPYIKLLSQLFGNRMCIANATGCSSIWGGSVGLNPYTTDENGHGPTWGNSLFEDNAEYGFGMVMANAARRRQFSAKIDEVLTDEKIKISEPLRLGLLEWIEKSKIPEVCDRLNFQLTPLLEAEKDNHIKIHDLYDMRDMIVKISHWIVGGDGWAYDIDFGGLDHVLACGEDVNIIVLDTEVYSNTGGQKSKSTPMGAVAKFAYSGKVRPKKELGLLAMQYQDVYVASCSIGTNMSHTLRCFIEAESYPGTSLLLCFAPCISHGSDLFRNVRREKEAVDSGYWSLYRFNPLLALQGINPFQLDSKKIKSELKDFLKHDNRFNSLVRTFPQQAEILHNAIAQYAVKRHEKLKQYAAIDPFNSSSGVSDPEHTLTILYGSETGNAEDLSGDLEKEATRRQFKVVRCNLDDFDYEEQLSQIKYLAILCSTCGQGEFPENSRNFWKWISNPQLSGKLFSNLHYSVFGLGDSNYALFNKAALAIDQRLAELGAVRLTTTGLGNDQDPEGKETKYEEWCPLLWQSLKAIEPPMETTPPKPNFVVEETKESAPSGLILPPDAVELKMTTNKRITPVDHDRDIRHYEFDITNTGLKYDIGDSLAIYPHNDNTKVEQFLKFYELDPNTVIRIKKEVSNPRIPEIISIKQLFSQVLDIFGRPSRRFYRMLLRFANPKEQKIIQDLVKPSGMSEYQKLTDESVTYADILMKFPSAHPGIEHLLDLIPSIKPRYYSIASSQRMHQNSIHLCIVWVDWETKSKVTKYGLCTSYLRIQKPGSSVSCCVKKSAFTLPPSPAHPIIMAGMGTGMAPFRAFVQDRAMLKRQNQEVGPISLFFGCRYRSKDFLYVDELEKYANEGVLTHLVPACSRDQEYKIYVQNKIEENANIVHDLMINKNGYFYMCGPAKKVPEQIRNAVMKSFMIAGKMDEKQADSIIVEMQCRGQYNIEAY